MRRKRSPQGYSADEFDRIVALVTGDAALRADIEAITGQKLDGKAPRELFDLFRSIRGATEVQLAVVRYGQVRRAVRQTRVDIESDPASLPPDVSRYVGELQAKVDDERRRRIDAETALKTVRSRNVLPLPAGDSARRAVAR